MTMRPPVSPAPSQQWHILLVLFVVSCLFAILLNALSLQAIRDGNSTNERRNGRSTVYGATVWSVDNSWYVRQIENIVAGHGYTIDPEEPTARFSRSPVYPLFFGLHFLLFGEQGAYTWIRVTQVAFFAISVLFVYCAAEEMPGSLPKASRSAALLYALCPFVATYTYYTITEAVTPALVAMCVWMGVRLARRGGQRMSFLLGLVVALTVLTRPVTGLLLPVLLIHRARCPRPQRLVELTLIVTGFAVGLAPWVARNYLASGEVIVLERTPHLDPKMDRAWASLRSWWECWGNPEIWLADSLVGAGEGTTAGAAAEVILSRMPQAAFGGSTRDAVKASLIAYVECERSENQECREAVSRRFGELESSLRRAAPVHVHFVAPLRRASGFFFHSFSSPFALLDPEKGRLSAVQFGVKALFFALTALTTLSMFMIVCWRWAPGGLGILLLFPIATVWYVAWIHRTVEVRYLLPAYPILHIALGFLLVGLPRVAGGSGAPARSSRE